MKLIIGLGNPGILYSRSRHNVGFLVVKALAKRYKKNFKKEAGALCLSAKAKISGRDILLALPLTFMNASGAAVAGLIQKYKLDLPDFLVICDDLDLEFGRLKLRPAGSSGGHRGLQSIIDSLASQGFARLRIGIGRPRNQEASDFVLSHFNRRERQRTSQIISRAARCCESWVTNGVSGTMNIFNQRSKSNESR